MNFKKFTDIENSYRTKFIDTFQKHCDQDIHNVKYVAREKLDGANIQLVFTPNQPMKIGKRTSYLNEGDSFFDIWNTLKKYENQLKVLQNYADGGRTLRVYGEIYGQGINGRIDYGPEKQIAIFDIYENDRLLSQRELEIFLEFLDDSLVLMLPKLFGYYDNLQSALEVDVEIKSETNGKAVIEGVVIQPYESVLYSGNGSHFILKKKSKAFEDKKSDSTQKAEPKEGDLIYDLNKKFRGYINKNRVLDTFAKYGTITAPQEFGKYVQLVMEDAKKDFLKDNELPKDLDKKQEKQLYKIGGELIELLKEHL